MAMMTVYIAWESTLMFIGLTVTISISLHLYKSLKFAFNCHFLRWFDRQDLVSTYGPWAVVTGASGGIGLGIVKKLASEGVNIVLTARSLTTMQHISRSLGGLRIIVDLETRGGGALILHCFGGLSSHFEKEKYNVKTKVIVCDATKRNSYQEILDQISGLDVGILVNNVGVVPEEGLVHLGDTSLESIYNVNTVNCGISTLLLRFVLPDMMKKRRGLIVNISSLGAYYPITYQALYSGTKIYLDVLSQAVRDEVRGSGVVVKAVRPFIVKSKMTAINSLAYKSPLGQTPEQFATSFLPTLANDLTTSGFWLIDLLLWCFLISPPWCQKTIAWFMLWLALTFGKPVELN